LKALGDEPARIFLALTLIWPTILSLDGKMTTPYCFQWNKPIRFKILPIPIPATNLDGGGVLKQKIGNLPIVMYFHDLHGLRVISSCQKLNLPFKVVLTIRACIFIDQLISVQVP